MSSNEFKSSSDLLMSLFTTKSVEIVRRLTVRFSFYLLIIIKL